jgi:MarR family 2-MHQ and catechol resistance regulon transcriptional repressor
MKDLSTYIDAYSFVEFTSGQTIINLSRTLELMRIVYKRFYNAYNLSEPKFFVLLLLSKAEDGIPLNEIGKMMLVSRANMTTLIERMVKEGYVAKQENEEDKRSTKAVLTTLGKQIYDEVIESHKEFSQKLVCSLTEEEQDLMNGLLKKIQFGVIEEFSKYEESEK